MTYIFSALDSKSLSIFKVKLIDLTSHPRRKIRRRRLPPRSPPLGLQIDDASPHAGPRHLDRQRTVRLLQQHLQHHVVSAQVLGHVVLGAVVVREGDPGAPVIRVEQPVEAAEGGKVGALVVVAAGHGCVSEVATMITVDLTVPASDEHHGCGVGSVVVLGGVPVAAR